MPLKAATVVSVMFIKTYGYEFDKTRTITVVPRAIDSCDWIKYSFFTSYCLNAFNSHATTA